MITPPNSTNLLRDKWYFYVPAGLEKVAFFEESAVAVQVFDADGQEVDAEGQRGLIVMQVPEGQDGRIWSLKGFVSSQRLRMLNVPQVLAWSPAGLLVPSDAER